MSQCKKFAPNIFHKTKCSNCFRQKEEHSAEALECNRASRSIARSGYLFVAPDWDFSVPLNRNKRWQRRWFVLYDDGELNYSVDEHPDTVPQGSVDMSKVLEVTGAEQVTGHPHSLALTSPDRVTFVKAASREDARWWAELLAVFPRRHKRNATFPGGRASPSLPQLGRSASPQPPRPRHLSVNGPSPRTNFETPPLKEERETPPKEDQRPEWLPERTSSLAIETLTSPVRNDYLISSGSPPTRDKLRCDDKARARRDWRNERLRDIATALTDRSPESSLALPAEGLLHLKKGWLWMRSNDNEWVRRWIVLCGPTLSVYQDQDEQDSPELVVELSTVTNYNEIPTESKYGFEIRWNCGQTLILSAVTHGIRSNWLQALKKGAPIIPIIESPITPPTPRSILLSSDEEYRTASEGGRRGSEDWSELPPSPPLTRLPLNRTKSNRCRIGQRLSRNQSRQSTLDSTSTDELDCAKIVTDCIVEHKSLIEVEELQKQLTKALTDVESLQEEIARLKKLQSEAAIREKRTNDVLLNYERTEKELNQRNTQTEMKFLKEQRSFQRKLAECEELSHTYEEKCSILTRELQTKQRLITNLQDELTNTNERLLRNRQDNDKLYKRIQELEGRYSLRQNSIGMVDSLTDLTNIDLDLDIDELGQNELKEYCLDLKCRFEKAILEIRAVKRELRDSHDVNDQLELTCFSLQDNIKKVQLEHNSEMNLLIARIDHLTSKLSHSEKQLKFKLKSDSKDKRRSLSLKGQRESFSINKEVEDKVTELEAKILALERGKTRRKHRRDRSNERNSPIDDKSLRRLRRKSLDSATTSEPMKILMRLSTLESQVTNVNVSNESLNLLNNSITDLTKISDENNDLNKLITQALLKLNDCLSCVNLLKSNRTKRATSPTFDKLVTLENLILEVSDLLNGKSGICTAEADVINTSVNSVVKQLQTLLLDKLTNLSERRRLLQENNKYDTQAKLEILAEKIAYENILINRIQEALLCTPTTANSEAICDRLINKERKETAHLLIALQNKLNGSEKQQQHPTLSAISCRTSADYLTKVLSKCLISTAQGFKHCKNFITKKSPPLNVLREEQKRLATLFNNYKTVKLPQLADALATETLYLSTDKTCRLRTLNDDIINDFNRHTHDVVNSELIQSEINHILIRAAQIYQTNFNADHTYFFSFFASERAALELWCDQVGDCLYNEITSSITELNEQYQNSLNKLQRQNWRKRVELERNTRSTNNFLHEYADIVAHKALIDARINVLCGKHSLSERTDDSSRDLPTSAWLSNEQYWNLIENQSSVQIDQSLEAEFVCMLDRYSGECFAILGQPELDEVMGYLDDVHRKVDELQRYANVPMNREDDIVVNSWNDVCKKCKCLRDNLDGVRKALNESNPVKKSEFPDEYHRPPVYLGTEYLTHVENLRAAYRCALASCKAAAGSNTDDFQQEADIEKLRSLCERVLGSMEQWHRRTIQELREQHARELEVLKQDKEQALAEETQATLAALDAMRKAHEAEVQREVARFKQEFTRQQRDEMTDLTEQLNVKCLEAAALEEQLGGATRQLAHAKQHIIQLERNPQLSLVQN